MKELLSIKEYADKKNISIPQVYYDIRFGKIPADQIVKEQYDYIMKRTRIKGIYYDSSENTETTSK